MIERRSLATPASVRARGKDRYVQGYSPKWNSRSEDLGFREAFRPYAFTHSLRTNPDVLCYFSHDQNRILGRTSSGTLEVSQDATGLFFRCLIPNTTDGNDLIELMSRGDINAASFGFIVEQGGEDWTREADGTILRTISKATLLEVSPVGVPAYPESKIALRNAPADIREALSNATCSHTECRNCSKPVNTRDMSDEDNVASLSNPAYCSCGFSERQWACNDCSLLVDDENPTDAYEGIDDVESSSRALLHTLRRRALLLS